jgi:hypothetical protein
MRIRLAKWVFWWGALGGLVPLLLILRWKLLGGIFGQFELILWPSSLATMGLEGGHHTTIDIVGLYTILIAGNVLLYCGLACLTWPIVRFFLARRRGVV